MNNAIRHFTNDEFGIPVILSIQAITSPTAHDCAMAKTSFRGALMNMRFTLEMYPFRGNM